MNEFKIMKLIYKFRENFLVSLFLVLVISYFLTRVIVIFSDNIELANGEANNVWNILNVLNGRSLYMPPGEKPYEIFQYAPLSQLVYIAIIKIFNINDVLSIYKLLRFFNLIFNILTSLYVFKILKSTIKINNNVHLWLSFLSLLLLTHQNWIIRPDAFSTFICFFAAGLSFEAINKNQIHKAILSGGVTTISIFCKQDGMQLFFIIPIAYLLLSYYKFSLYYVTSAIISFILLFSVFNIIYGNVFLESVIGGIDNEISFFVAFSVTNRYFQIFSLYPIVILTIVVYNIFKVRDKICTFISLLILGSFVFAISISLKPGAWINYFTLFNLLGVIIIGYFMQSISNINIFKSIYLLFAFYFFSGILFHYISPSISSNKLEFEKKKQISNKVKHYVYGNSCIYTNDKYLKLFLYDKTIFPNQEYYFISKFKYNNLSEVKKNLFVILETPTLDYVLRNIMKINNKDLKIVSQIDNFTLYKYDNNK